MPAPICLRQARIFPAFLIVKNRQTKFRCRGRERIRPRHRRFGCFFVPLTPKRTCQAARPHILNPENASLEKEQHMIIGKFRKDDNGCFTGSIPFITSGSAAISIAPVVRPGTDYTVTFKYDEAIEIGQARFRKTNNGDKFLAVTLDTPHLRESIT